MSGDALKPEPGPLPDVPYQREDWEEAWANMGGGHSREHRIRGLDVIHRIKEGLSLSPREEFLAKNVHENETWKEYREAGMSEEAIVKIMVDNIGSLLADPEGNVIDGVTIIDLSDERPPEQGATG